MTVYAFPYTPGPVSGIWQVNLPPDACIGEVILYATAPETEPWDAPTAPPGSTTTVAVTFVTPGAWIAGDGLSMVAPNAVSFTIKILFRSTRHSGPPASPISTFTFTGTVDINDDGSYSGVGFTPAAVVDWDYYGPGDTLPEGSTVPADGAALYVVFQHPSAFIRWGPPDVVTSWQDDVPNLYWHGGAPADVYQQRFDDEDDHVQPLWPYLLP